MRCQMTCNPCYPLAVGRRQAHGTTSTPTSCTATARWLPRPLRPSWREHSPRIPDVRRSACPADKGSLRKSLNAVVGTHLWTGSRQIRSCACPTGGGMTHLPVGARGVERLRAGAPLIRGNSGTRYPVSPQEQTVHHRRLLVGRLRVGAGLGAGVAAGSAS